MAWPLRRVLAKRVLINTTWNPLGSFCLFSWCLWPFQDCRHQTKPFLRPKYWRGAWGADCVILFWCVPWHVFFFLLMGCYVTEWAWIYYLCLSVWNDTRAVKGTGVQTRAQIRCVSCCSIQQSTTKQHLVMTLKSQSRWWQSLSYAQKQHVFLLPLLADKHAALTACNTFFHWIPFFSLFHHFQVHLLYSWNHSIPTGPSFPIHAFFSSCCICPSETYRRGEIRSGHSLYPSNWCTIATN